MLVAKNLGEFIPFCACWIQIWKSHIIFTKIYRNAKIHLVIQGTKYMFTLIIFLVVKVRFLEAVIFKKTRCNLFASLGLPIIHLYNWNYFFLNTVLNKFTFIILGLQAKKRVAFLLEFCVIRCQDKAGNGSCKVRGITAYLK